MMAKRFTLMDIAEVNFHGGDGNSRNRVSNGNAGVSVGGWIDD